MNYPFPEGMLDKKRFDYVIHAASNAHPVAFSKDPVGTMKTNLLGTINLLDKIDNTTKFLYLSSGEIYGNGIGDEIFSEKSIGRVDSKQFRSCYPESKRAAETLCVSYLEQYGIKTYIARLCYVYGPDITQDNTRADAQFLRNAINHENIVLKSDGLTKRSYCYVADAVCALLFILNKGKFDFYNIANPDSNITIKEYAETLAHIAGVNLSFSNPSVDEIKGFSRSTSSILDSSKLIELGWKPIYSIEQGLRNTFNLYNYTFYK